MKKTLPQEIPFTVSFLKLRDKSKKLDKWENLNACPTKDCQPNNTNGFCRHILNEMRFVKKFSFFSKGTTCPELYNELQAQIGFQRKKGARKYEKD